MPINRLIKNKNDRLIENLTLLHPKENEEEADILHFIAVCMEFEVPTRKDQFLIRHTYVKYVRER